MKRASADGVGYPRKSEAPVTSTPAKAGVFCILENPTLPTKTLIKSAANLMSCEGGIGVHIHNWVITEIALFKLSFQNFAILYR